jgi:hypothetical protein
VPFTITKTANLCLATAALPILLPILLMDISRFNPLATASTRAVYPILRRELLELPIPSPLKIYIEQLVDVFEGYVVGDAALRWHMLWVDNGKFEEAFHARVAHSVTAF